MTHGTFDVEHLSPILDVGNSLVLRQFPVTSVWLDSTHRMDALMCTRSIGLHDTPYTKVLSHLRFLFMSTYDDQGIGLTLTLRLVAGSYFSWAAKPSISWRLREFPPALHLAR
jgi:hypothetical protein